MNSSPFERILEFIDQLAAGKLDARIPYSNTNEDLDAIEAGLNMFAEELEESMSSLQTMRDYLDNIINTMADTLIVVNPDNTIRTVNQATLSLLGYEEQELIGKPAAIIMRDEEEEDKQFRGIEFEALINKELIQKMDTIYRAKSGKKIPMLFSSSIMHENGEIQGIVCVALDNTAQKQAEEHIRKLNAELEQRVDERTAELRETTQLLVQAEKMSATGTMAAGIAHELNNPMMGILNYVQYCLEHTTAKDKRHPILLNAEREIERCAEILKNMLTFAHMEQEEPETVISEDCTVLLERAIQLLSHRIRDENVELICNYNGAIPKVKVKSNQIQQVCFNLASNALDAMKQTEAKKLRLEVDRFGDNLQIVFNDSGSGMDKKQLSKIFDPFFTTKPPGQGTGLGLSVCRSIVEEHGGDINCVSIPRQGTTFTVTLPLKEQTYLQH